MAQKAKKVEVPVMEEGAILKASIKERGITQIELADRIGIRQSTLSDNINRRRMSLKVFGEVLNAMEYDIAVVDRNTGEIMWKVDVK